MRAARCVLNSITKPRPCPVVIHSFRTVVNRRAHTRYRMGFNKLPSVLLTYINNNSGTVKLFRRFIGRPAMQVVNVRTTNDNMSDNGRTTALATKQMNMLRKTVDCLLRSASNRIVRTRSVDTKLSCPNINPRRDFLGSTNQTRCCDIASRTTLSTFRQMSQLRKVVPTLRATRTFTCLRALYPRLANGPHVIVGSSKQNSGSIGAITGTLNSLN